MTNQNSDSYFAAQFHTATLLALLAGTAVSGRAMAQPTNTFPAQFELSSLLPAIGGNGDVKPTILGAVDTSDFAQGQDLEIYGNWFGACSPVGCSTGCSNEAVFSYDAFSTPGQSEVEWGSTDNPDATNVSALVWHHTLVPELPEDGDEIRIGRVVFANGRTDIGSEIGSVLLLLETNNPLLIPTMPILEFCILTTRNDSGDPFIDRDRVFIPQIGHTISANEDTLHAQYVIMAVANRIMVRVGVKDEIRVELTPSRVIPDSPGASVELTPEVQLDYLPGECPNAVFVRDDALSIFESLAISPNPAPNYVLTFPGNYSADDVDLASLRLIHPGLGELTPARVEVADITSPISKEGVCGCAEDGRGPDGDLDISLSYYGYLIELRMNSIGALDGDTVQIGVRGLMKDGTIFQASDCIEIHRAP